jgi:hypothetical protein
MYLANIKEKHLANMKTPIYLIRVHLVNIVALPEADLSENSHQQLVNIVVDPCTTTMSTYNIKWL